MFELEKAHVGGGDDCQEYSVQSQDFLYKMKTILILKSNLLTIYFFISCLSLFVI